MDLARQPQLINKSSEQDNTTFSSYCQGKDLPSLHLYTVHCVESGEKQLNCMSLAGQSQSTFNSSEQNKTTFSSYSKETINVSDMQLKMDILCEKLLMLADEVEFNMTTAKQPTKQSQSSMIAICQYQVLHKLPTETDHYQDIWVPPAPSPCLMTPTSFILPTNSIRPTYDSPTTSVPTISPELPSAAAMKLWMKPGKNKRYKKKKNDPRSRKLIYNCEIICTYSTARELILLTENLILASKLLMNDLNTNTDSMTVKDQFGCRFVKDMLEYALEGTEKRKTIIDSLDSYGYSGDKSLNTGVMGKLARMRKLANDILALIRCLLEGSKQLINLDQSLDHLIKSTVEVQVSYEMLSLDIYLWMKLNRPPITVERGYMCFRDCVRIVEDEHVTEKYNGKSMAKPKLLNNLQRILDAFNVNSKLDLVQTIFLPFRKIPQEVVKTLVIDSHGTLKASEIVITNTVCQQNVEECIVNRQTDRVLPLQFWQSVPQMIPLVDPLGSVYSSFSLDIGSWTALHYIQSEILNKAVTVCLQHMLLEWELFNLLVRCITHDESSHTKQDIPVVKEPYYTLSVDVGNQKVESEMDVKLQNTNLYSLNPPLRFLCFDFILPKHDCRQIKSESDLLATLGRAYHGEEMIVGFRRHTMNCVRSSVCEYKKLSNRLSTKEQEIMQEHYHSKDIRSLSKSSFELYITNSWQSLGKNNTPKRIKSLSHYNPTENSKHKSKRWFNSKAGNKFIQIRESGCVMQ